MRDFRTIADRVEIEALRGDFTDAGMMHDYDRFASLFTIDGAWRMPHIPIELLGRDSIRAGVERMQSLWAYFVQTAHPGATEIDGDSATGRGHVAEFGLMRNGASHANYAIYHDRYERTAEGWKFSERLYEVRYEDGSHLTGSVPGRAGSDE